jgi:two-component system sensor histidine kinase UhpB
LTNAIRHAGAKHVTVKLDPMENGASLRLAVVDDGRGMSQSTPAGFGTRGMKERVEGLGGRYSVESEPGRGTSVRITIPLAEGMADAGTSSGVDL